MDLSSLRCSVQRNNSFRFTYTLHMKYKHTEWYMEKSFADFEQLQETLVYQEFTDVPLLPDLQLSHGIDTLGELCNSELALEKFIREVLRRPDTRACIDVLTFCDLLRRLDNAPAPVFATLLTETPCCHLAVSDVQYLQDDRLMIVSHEEKTALSKIGRMWTIIEPDTLGVVRVYRIEDNVTDGCTQILHKIFHNKVRGVEYVRESKTLIVAKDDGYAELFRLDEDATNFDVIGTLALHCGPILSISVRDGLCFTSGYDDSIRVFDVERQKTLSGGKLTRRLNGEKLLVSEATSPRTMFIATTDNRVYTYYMTNDVPILVDCCNIPSPLNIRKIRCTPSNLFVAHGNCVSCFRYSRYPVEQLRERQGAQARSSGPSNVEMTGVTQRHHSGAEVVKSDPDCGTICFPMSIRSAQFSVQSNESSFSSYQVYDMVLRTREKQLLVAYDEVVAIWCILKGVMLYSWYAHRNAQVHVLRLIEPQGLVLTGGSDGEVRIWRLPDASQLALWNPAAA